ncbi:MAG: hypothetical protein DNFNHJIP_00518 [Candidatus Argoarchaeum ethanivorans]|jgi:uncharacterized protein YuzE|uniref:DUF2283 domain-containing protein n=1 Tax=Candidatus Argoarchaeum ethanivorans TaxID=2608793 RepID=A0A812A161_9EURY|nr:MAG: hypothetical protein DNFNHJIP_00518 [Candidatus Argoarchaeum ethanivorans]
MRLKVDMESDALYVRLSEEPIEESEEVSGSIIIDYSKDGKVVGIELLGIKDRFSLEELSTLKVELPTIAYKNAPVPF